MFADICKNLGCFGWPRCLKSLSWGRRYPNTASIRNNFGGRVSRRLQVDHQLSNSLSDFIGEEAAPAAFHQTRTAPWLVKRSRCAGLGGQPDCVREERSR